MNMPPRTLILLGIIALCSSTSEKYFDCYKDKCIRGLQHCVHIDNEYRCHYCEHIADQCGNESMPRDCDSFCLDLELKNVKAELEAIKNEKLNLEESVKHMNNSLVTVTNEKNQLKVENTNFASDKDELVLELNTTNGRYQRLQQQHVDLQNISRQKQTKLEECTSMKWGLVPVVVVAVTFAALALVIVVVCVCRRRKHHNQVPLSGRGGAYKAPERKMPEETSLMIEVNDVENTMKNIKRSQDSGMDLPEENASSNKSEGSDTEVDEHMDSDKSLVRHVRSEPTVRAKSLGASSVEEENTLLDKSHDKNMRAERKCGDSKCCPSKGTPAALKGIAPTSHDASSYGKHQTVCS